MSAIPIVVAAILAGQSGLAEPTDAQWQKCTEGSTEVRIESCEGIAADSKLGKPSRAFAAATLGDIYLDQRNLEKAVGEFTRAIRLHPDYAYSHRRRAFVRYLQGRHDDAVSDYDTAVELAPLDPYTFIARSSYYRQTERWDQARADVENALELDLNNPDSYYERGLLSLDVKDYEQAELDFGKIIKLNPADNDARYNLANALRNQSRGDEALSSVTQYIEAEPDDPQGFRLRGWIQIDLGNVEAAKEDFTTALSAEPESRSLQYALGYANWRAGDYQRALKHYQLAEPEYRSSGYYYYERGYAHYMLNQDIQALADADQALEIDSDDYDAMWLKGAALLYLDDYPLALETLNRAATLAPDNPEILTMRGRVNLAAGQYLSAVGDFSMALDKKPDSLPAEIYRAYATGLAGGMALATATLEDILKRDPDSALATELIARLFYKSEDYMAARSYSGKLVRLIPDYAAHKVLHGDILLELGEYAEAAEVYSAAVSATDEPPANWLRMAAYAAHKANHTDTALEYLQRASRADRSDVWTQGMLGDLFYKRAAFDDARKAYEQALENSEDEKEKDGFRLDIARSLAGSGSFQQALEMVDPLVRRNPANADIVWTRASILVDVERLEDALAGFEDYRQLKPSSLKVQYRIVDVLSALGQHRRAIEVADTIVYMEEDKAGGYQTRGKLYLALEDYQAASLDFSRAAEFDPDDVATKLMQARALIGMGEAEQALEVLGSVTEPEARQAELLHLKAKAEEMLGERDAAKKTNTRAKAAEKGDVSPQTVGLQENVR